MRTFAMGIAVCGGMFFFMGFLYYSSAAIVARWEAFMAVGWKGWVCLIMAVVCAFLAHLLLDDAKSKKPKQ